MCVPTIELRQIIEEVLADRGGVGDVECGVMPNQNAALQAMAERVVAVSNGQRVKSAVVRTLFRVRTLETPTVPATFADVVLIAVERQQDLATLTHLAYGLPLAREAVEAFSLHVEELSEEEETILAHKLNNFSNGFVSDLDTLTPERVLAQRERMRVKRRQNDQQAVAA